jgi:hypothetical protein
VGGRRRPFALEDGGGERSFCAVVLGWSWWGYGHGRAMVLGGGMVVVVASGCCCSWAAFRFVCAGLLFVGARRSLLVGGGWSFLGGE